MNQLTKLDPALRENLRNLLQGYIEHCEMSDSLIARIETPIYFHGFKFGAPVFTHRHPASRPDLPPVGIVGVNEPSNPTPSEIVLQIIEILSQHPGQGGFRPIHLLPVANPVALELGETAPSSADWPILDHLIEDFQEKVPAGILSIRSSPDEGFSIEGTATPGIFRNIASLTESSRSLRHVELSPADGDAWQLQLGVPSSLSSGAVLAAARFTLSLIRPR